VKHVVINDIKSKNQLIRASAAKADITVFKCFAIVRFNGKLVSLAYEKQGAFFYFVLDPITNEGAVSVQHKMNRKMLGGTPVILSIVAFLYKIETYKVA
jgi:hypothetical protein